MCSLSAGRAAVAGRAADGPGLEPGIIDIVPTPAKFARSALSESYTVMITQPVTTDLEEVARADADSTVRLPIARTVPLTEADPDSPPQAETPSTTP
ncbi:hypothetical protein ABZ372_51740 [Streptomyces sp. NPDC005921]